MLILTRKSHEQIQIGDNITITILRLQGKGVQVGIDAPRNMIVLRKELCYKQRLSDAIATDEPSGSTDDTTPVETAKRVTSRSQGGKRQVTARLAAANPIRTQPTDSASTNDTLAPLMRYVAHR